MRSFLAALLFSASAMAGDYDSTPDLLQASTHIPYSITRAVFVLEGSTSGTTLSPYASADIPPGAIVMHTWYEESSAVVSASSNTVAVGCESSGDMIAGVSLDGGSSFTQGEGIQDNTFANRKRLGLGCSPTATFGAGASGITSGRLTVVFLYVPLD